MFHTEFVDMFIINHHITVYMPTYNGLSVIAIKWKAKTDVLWLPHSATFYKKVILTMVPYFLKIYLLSHKTSGLYCDATIVPISGCYVGNY
jgi:hypothetical protein